MVVVCARQCRYNRAWVVVLPVLTVSTFVIDLKCGNASSRPQAPPASSILALLSPLFRTANPRPPAFRGPAAKAESLFGPAVLKVEASTADR